MHGDAKHVRSFDISGDIEALAAPEGSAFNHLAVLVKSKKRVVESDGAGSTYTEKGVVAYRLRPKLHRGGADDVDGDGGECHMEEEEHIIEGFASKVEMRRFIRLIA